MSILCPFTFYAENQGRTGHEQWHHDLALYGPAWAMKGYVNWVRAHHPGNRRKDGSLIHALIP